MADTFKFELTGVKTFQMGDVGAAGTMGSSLTEYTGVKEGTMTFDLATPTTNDINIEETDFPYAQQLTGSAKNFTFELLNLTLSKLPNFLGGTFTAGTGGTKDTYEFPSAIPNILQSVEIVSTDSEGQDTVYNFVKCRVSGFMSQTNTKTDMIGLQVNFAVLQPVDGSGDPTTPISVEGETIA